MLFVRAVYILSLAPSLAVLCHCRSNYPCCFDCVRFRGFCSPAPACGPDRACAGIRSGPCIALEEVSRRWKRRNGNAGSCIRIDYERLMNTLYADYILLYVKPLDDFTLMMDILDEELAFVGLRMHDMKTKILTRNDSPQFH